MIVNIIEHFSTLEDVRRDHPSKLHKLIDIIVIALCAVIAKCETWEEIADYAVARYYFFKEFLELPNGIPSHDTINRTFSRIDPILWQELFVSWMKLQTPESLEKIRLLDILEFLMNVVFDHNPLKIARVEFLIFSLFLLF